MDIVVLKAGDPPEELAARRGDFARWIAETIGDAWSGGYRVHDIRGEEALPTLESAAAFVITGSSSNVTERAPWMLRAEDFVRAAVGAKTPLFGICFGHQMMAHALGGQVVKNPRGREIGTVRIERTADDPIFLGLPRAFDVSETHVESVARLPEGARLLAASALDPAAAFAVGDHARAVQFHPEIDGDAMAGYVRARDAVIRADGLDADAILASVREAPHAGQVLRNFVSEIVLPRRPRGA